MNQEWLEQPDPHQDCEDHPCEECLSSAIDREMDKIDDEEMRAEAR